MKIGLFGFTFSHENMGCQALTCAFLDMLKKTLPEEELEIVDFHSDNTLGSIPELFPAMHFKICHVNIKDLKFTYLKEVKSCDLIFDETYGDGFSDIYFGKSVYLTVIVKYLCARTKTPYIFTPQTYGPFKRKMLERLSGAAIRKADYVFARDRISGDYAEKISGREVITVTDLAFALPYQKDSKDNEKLKLGINVSGLLWNGGFNNEQNQFGLMADYKDYCRKVIRFAINEGYEVHIIPHVTVSAEVRKVSMDGDYPACEKLADEFSQVVLAPCFENPYDAKNYIANMDFFIGARMHSTIAAFSTQVVTIPFAYSRKFKGLYENLNYPFYIDGTAEDTNVCYAKTVSWIKEPMQLINCQEKAMSEVSKELAIFESSLNDILLKANRLNGKEK